MPEIKKTIVIASVLKPVSDTRMTEKIAATLASNEHLDVHVIGYPAEYSPKAKITLHSFAAFKRISFTRMVTPFKIFKLIRKIKPSVLIVTTHELLGVALLTKLFTRAKVVYDLQENYYLNILHTTAFPPVVKHVIAAYVKLKETLAARWIDHFFLAEKVYLRQLPFARHNHTVLENKVIDTFPSWSNARDPLALLFSGTLARSTGVFEAIALVRELHKTNSKVTLTIIGYAAKERELRQIHAEVRNSDFIKLIGGDAPVIHQEIVQAIMRSGAGIVSYQQNPATQGRTPTKLFEYLAADLPILFTDVYPEWEALARKVSHEFLVVNSHHADYSAIINWLHKTKPRGTSPSYVLWKTEEMKLETAISAL